MVPKPLLFNSFMKRFYRFGISSLLIMLFFGWMINCTGTRNSSYTPSFINLNTSEVITSDWINANQWVTTTVFGLPARTCELTSKHFNPNLLEENQLYVYSKIDEQVHPMPFNIRQNSTELRFDYTMPTPSTLKIVMIGLKGNLKPMGDQQYRYVLIPNSLVKKSPIDMGDYETVKTAFHLED